jgi:hypothetical protein
MRISTETYPHQDWIVWINPRPIEAAYIGKRLIEIV